MKGDYSKIPFNDTKKKQHYRKVYLQQGRVLLDSDLNESTDLLHYQTKTLSKDVACLCGSPNNGFRIGKGLLLLPVDSKKGWSLEFSDGNKSEPTISYEPSDIFEGKGSLMVKDATKAIFTPQKPINLSRYRWIRLGLKGKGNTVPENMNIKLSLESNGNTVTVEKGTEISIENGFSFFYYSLKNINPHDFKGIDKVTRIEFSGFDNKPEENGYLFNWNKILAKDNQELIEFLKLKYKTDWVKAEQVKISEDNKTIRLEDGKNYLLLNLNKEETRVNLEVNDINRDEFAAITDRGELKVYLGKSYLIGIVECSPPMFTLDTTQSGWRKEPENKVGADVSTVSENEEGLVLEAKGITALKKELSPPADFSNYATMEFALKRIGSSTSIEFYITDVDKNEGSWKITDFSNADLKKHTISLKDQNPEAKTNMKSVIEYGFRQLSPGDIYNFGRILYEIDPNNNFAIAGSDILSGETGRLYVNGELYEKEDIETYLNQKEYPYPPSIVPPDSGERKDLVYAEVWHRHITPLEDLQLRETALGGPDTCNRIKAVAQVKVLPGAESLPGDMLPKGGGRLSTVLSSSLTVKSCEMLPESEYTGWDNRLYRVEMYHTDKPAFVPGHTWIPPVKTPPLFKWSKNNASTTSPIMQNVEKDASSVVVKDSRLFKIGDTIEITDDLVELLGIYEELRIIKYIDPDENRLFWEKNSQNAVRQSVSLPYTGVLSRTYIAEGIETTHPKVIKWDGIQPASSESNDLGDGVKIKFSGSSMRKGDYWTFTARAITHEVERLENEPPHGTIRHYCPLALIHWNGSKIDRIEDIRGRFKPLGELSASDIAFDCKNSAVLANNVQQAIENLQIRLDYGTNLDLIAGSLTLRGSELDKSHWPKLTCSKREDGTKHGDICFLTGDNPQAEKMRILEEGHVGIGTMNPKNDEAGDKWEKVLDIYSCLNARLSIRTDGIDARVQVQEESDKVKGKVWKDVPDGMIVGTKTKSKLSLATEGKARMVVDEDGKVGIGLFDPKAKLHVEATDRPTIIAQGNFGGLISGSSGGHGVFGTNIYVDSSHKLKTAGTHPNNYGYAGMHATWGNIHFYAAGGNTTENGDINPTSRLFIRGSDGFVGIGTTEPAASLDVANGAKFNQIAIGTAPFGTLPNYAYESIQLPTWANLRINFGSTQTAIFKNDGKVGIGTEPSEKLEVHGNIKLTTYGIPSENVFVFNNSILAGTVDDSKSKALNFIVRQGRDSVIRTREINAGEGWTKNFLISHPLYPDTHELAHSTLEGPEVAVFYRGEAQLSDGETTVPLPDYFEALTRKENRTVLLTPKFEEDTKVSILAASEVKDGKFTVKMIDNNNPSQKFYWEVKAIRSDVGILEVERKKVSV